MVFTRFVEIGRAVLINYGPDAGKIAFIVDVVDHSRVLVEGPTTGVTRQVISFKRANLTDIKIDIPRGIRSAGLTKKLAKQDAVAKWEKTAWAKKLVSRKQKAALTDLDRFKLFLEKKKAKKTVKA